MPAIEDRPISFHFDTLFYDDFFNVKWVAPGDTRVITWSWVDDVLTLPNGASQAVVQSSAPHVPIYAEAFSLWDAALSSVTFVQTGEGNAADVTLAVTDIDGVGGIAGFWNSIWSGGIINRSTIRFDPVDIGPTDLLTTALHEIGNVLGLGDILPSGDIRSVQEDPFPETFAGLMLWPDDLNIIRAYYGEDAPTVGGNGDSTLMSTIFLSANDTFTQPSSNTNDRIFGRPGGSETVILQGNPIGTLLDGNIETIHVAGPASNTVLQVNALTGRLELGSEGVVYATFSGGINQAIDLKFTNGNVTLTQTGANSFTIANPTNPGSSATITLTTSQAGSAVPLGGSTSTAGDPVTTGPAPTFNLSANIASVDEGATATFTLITTNVSAGTSVSYSIWGTGVTAADIVGSLTGVATIGADGSANIAVQIAADQLMEGSETLTLSLDNGQASASTVIQDTSVASANSYTSGLGLNRVTSSYNIEVIFVGTFDQIDKNAFITAADYLSTIIVGDLPNVGAIDDIRITAELTAIDGPGGTLGSAGPTILRSGSALPSEGAMQFDTADVASMQAEGTFVDTVLHEMIHALGFGTIWETLNLLQGTTDLRFTGQNAIAAYNAEFTEIAGADANSGTGIPVETDGGPGTAGGHWDKETFLTEMMTGFSELDSFVSAMSIASLEDLGYDTIFSIGTPAATMPQLDNFMMA